MTGHRTIKKKLIINKIVKKVAAGCWAHFRERRLLRVDFLDFGLSLFFVCCFVVGDHSENHDLFTLRTHERASTMWKRTKFLMVFAIDEMYVRVCVQLIRGTQNNKSYDKKKILFNGVSLSTVYSKCEM